MGPLEWYLRTKFVDPPLRQKPPVSHAGPPAQLVADPACLSFPLDLGRMGFVPVQHDCEMLIFRGHIDVDEHACPTLTNRFHGGNEYRFGRSSVLSLSHNGQLRCTPLRRLGLLTENVLVITEFAGTL